MNALSGSIRGVGAVALAASAMLGAVACREDATRADTVPSSSSSSRHVPAPKGLPPEPALVHPPKAPLACPDGMVLVPGGPFWVGSSAEEHAAPDESPRYLTRIAPFCLDAKEVTAGAYNACVESKTCEPPKRKWSTCNGGRKRRVEHPINCVTWPHADAFCRARGARLPSEAEWELAARGGEEYRHYPWGSEAPDGRTCWKRGGTCPVGSFEAGAYGLFDMSGNVWEWTTDWYGPYPWPPELGSAKVYRGGSWSRRFPKWLHTRLRNRGAPREWGSHLGFRCARSPPGVECPYGVSATGVCLHGVDARDCPAGRSWNGRSCAAPGAPPCPEGLEDKPGFGCVARAAPSARGGHAGSGGGAEDTSDVARERTPEFDEDCKTNQTTRPSAFRFRGGSYRARELVARGLGCKNRDVGVGWNSACCP